METRLLPSCLQVDQNSGKQFDATLGNRRRPKIPPDKCYLWKGRCQQFGHLYQLPTWSIKVGKVRRWFSVPRLVAIHLLALPITDTAASEKCPCGALNRKGERRVYSGCCMPITLHKCFQKTGNDFNGRCCNPYHLEIGTAKQNMDDCILDGKSTSLKGDANHMTKYSDEQIKRAWMLRTGKSQQERATITGVSISAIKHIDAGWTRNDITGLPSKLKERVRKRRKLTPSLVSAN